MPKPKLDKDGMTLDRAAALERLEAELRDLVGIAPCGDTKAPKAKQTVPRPLRSDDEHGSGGKGPPAHVTFLISDYAIKHGRGQVTIRPEGGHDEGARFAALFSQCAAPPSPVECGR